MRNQLMIAAVLTVAVTSVVWAQAPQQPNGTSSTEEQSRPLGRTRELLNDKVLQKQVELLRAMVEAREADRAKQRDANTCAGPGNTRVALNGDLFFDGRLYRCVEVFEPNDAPGMASGPLKRRGAGLVPVQLARPI